MSPQTPVITSSIQETAMVLLSADSRLRRTFCVKLSTGSQALAVRTNCCKEFLSSYGCSATTLCCFFSYASAIVLEIVV